MCGEQREPHQFNTEKTECLNPLCHWHKKGLKKWDGPFDTNPPLPPNSRRRISSPYSIKGFSKWRNRTGEGILEQAKRIAGKNAGYITYNSPCQVDATLTSLGLYGPNDKWTYWNWTLGELEGKFDEILSVIGFGEMEIGTSMQYFVQFNEAVLKFKTRSGMITTRGWCNSMTHTVELYPHPITIGVEWVYNSQTPTDFDGNFVE